MAAINNTNKGKLGQHKQDSNLTVSTIIKHKKIKVRGKLTKVPTLIAKYNQPQSYKNGV